MAEVMIKGRKLRLKKTNWETNSIREMYYARQLALLRLQVGHNDYMCRIG